jgi:hypothetical protein
MLLSYLMTKKFCIKVADVGRGIILAEKAYLGGSDYDNSCFNELDSFPDDRGPGTC